MDGIAAGFSPRLTRFLPPEHGCSNRRYLRRPERRARATCRMSAGPSAFCLLAGPIAEMLEFPVSRPSEERMPFARREPENGPVGIPAVPDTNAAVRQRRHFDAVAVGEAEGAFNPLRGTFHVLASLSVSGHLWKGRPGCAEGLAALSARTAGIEDGSPAGS